MVNPEVIRVPEYLLQGNLPSFDTITDMFFTYVLLCGDGNHYIGYTADVEKRFERHANGFVFATKGRLPVTLIFYEAFLHRQDAERRERYFKTTAGKRALKFMLREYFALKEQRGR